MKDGYYYSSRHPWISPELLLLVVDGNFGKHSSQTQEGEGRPNKKLRAGGRASKGKSKKLSRQALPLKTKKKPAPEEAEEEESKGSHYYILEIRKSERAIAEVIIWDPKGTEDWSKEKEEKVKIGILDNMFEGMVLPWFRDYSDGAKKGRKVLQDALDYFEFFVDPNTPVPTGKQFQEKILVYTKPEVNIRQDRHGFLADACGPVCAITMTSRIILQPDSSKLPSIEKIDYEKLRELLLA